MGLAMSSCVCTELDGETPLTSVLPLYYTDDHALTSEDVAAIRSSWEKITSSKGCHFTKLLRTNKTQHTSCSSLFGEALFDRLVDIHPAAAYLFKSPIDKHVPVFVAKLSEILATIENSSAVHTLLINLAVAHSKIGVHAIQYGIFGECLFHALYFSLQEEFTAYVCEAWVKMYSFMLSVIVPVALAEERKALWDRLPHLQSSLESTKHTAFLDDDSCGHIHTSAQVPCSEGTVDISTHNATKKMKLSTSSNSVALDISPLSEERIPCQRSKASESI